MKLVFDKVRSAPVPFFIKPCQGIADKSPRAHRANIKRQLDFMESELADRPGSPQGVHRRRHPDEFSAGGGVGPRRAGHIAAG